jgi:prepilin-type N-terminal cleavage/methylation domain-containing protein
MRKPPLNLLRRGFTLIELLVVMSILVVLLTIALPVFNYVTAARSTESGINMVSAMLGRARTLALNRPDDKYIGVLFYSHPDQDRDAMQLVEVEPEETSVALERYAGWQQTAPYLGPSIVPTDPPNPDVVYFPSQNRDFPGPFANRPMVKRFVALQNSTGQSPQAAGPTFDNAYWAVSQGGNTIPVQLDTEAQYLPRGVRVRVIRRAAPNYALNGIILFDKQGRLVTRKWGIVNDNNTSVDGGEKLLEAMGQPFVAATGKFAELPLTPVQVTGLGIAIFNDADMAEPRTDASRETYAASDATHLTVGTQSGELVQAQ